MSSLRKALVFLCTLVLLALPFIVWWKAQALTDWWQLRDYTPPAAITSLAGQDTMTPYAKHIFYVNHPQIVSTVSAFRQDCPEAEQTIVLGCYHPDQDGIFVYGVSDPQLNGVGQVTAAHEMLHAAYDRLSSSEKNYIDGLLMNYYNNDLTNQRIKDEIAGYQKTEPNDVVNEMHSVFGTEAGNLPTALENYYTRYFTSRATIVNFADSYQSEFTSREDQISADDAQLTSMKQNIDSEEAVLNTQSQKINNDRAQLDSLRSSGKIDAYNAGVDGFNAEVDAYNSGVQKLKSDIAAYNDLVARRNQIAQALASLSQAIDTRLTTQTAQ